MKKMLCIMLIFVLNIHTVNCNAYADFEKFNNEIIECQNSIGGGDFSNR